MSNLISDSSKNLEELKEIILKNIYTKTGKIKKGAASKIVEQYNLQDFDGDSPLEKLYIIVYGRQYCQVCGNKVKFDSWFLGYRKTCCVECQSKYQSVKGKIRRSQESEEVKQRRVQRYRDNCMLKYGVDSTSKLESTKEKNRKTCLERYGATCYSKTEEYHQKAAKTKEERYGNPNFVNPEKTKKTKQERYGDPNYCNTEKIKQTKQERYGDSYYINRDKSIETSKAKYGVDYYSQTDEYKERVKNTNQSKMDRFEEENDCLNIQKVVPDYGMGWKLSHRFDNQLLKYKNRLYVPKYLIKDIEEYFNNSLNNKSHAELDVLHFCESLIDDEILSGDRTTIKNSNGNYMELDIYIPSHKVAIEYNGMRWHNIVSIEDENYHLYKSELCKEQGIRLLYIWEDLWESKQDICKSIIASSLGVYNQKIYARNCECREISSEDYKDFLNKNHIQGEIDSSLRLGLYYNNELIQVAGWGKSKKSGYELHRMCSKLNTQVIGGFSKLIKHSGLNEFISYIDRDLYNGDGYKSCGFICLEDSKPEYFYYKDGSTRINKISKNELKDLLGDDFDSNLTEKENMTSNGYYLIYNSGSYMVKYIKS